MKLKLLIIGTICSIAIYSCKKEECHECHYEDANNDAIELGEKCGDDLEALERDGYTTGGVTYEVHCHEH